MWYGGPSLALKTVKQYTGIPINHVMVVSFQGFPRLVNSVGGIDMYVPQTVTTRGRARNHRVVTFEKGMHHFDGKNAMLYVRIRKAYAEGDFTRAARQQAFVQALQKKLVQAGQHHQAARDRQALHERRRHRPHHQRRSSSWPTSSGAPSGGKKQVHEGRVRLVRRRSGRGAAAERRRQSRRSIDGSWGSDARVRAGPRQA